MRGFGTFSAAAVTALALACPAGGAWAQTAASHQVGKPPAVLAGLKPPHEFKHRETRHAAHAKIAHGKTAARTRRGRLAAERARHVAAKKIAKYDDDHRERPITASAFAEEPQTASTLTPTSDWPAVHTAPLADNATAPAAETPSSSLDPSPSDTAVKVQTLRIKSPDQVNALDATAQPDAPPGTPVAAPSESAAAAPTIAPQSALAAPAQEQTSKTPVGSGSWAAQVLAALGGAIAAGAVAWFLIGSGPLRTYS